MKQNIPADLTKAINSLAKMPGVGRVSAKRAVLHMLQEGELLENIIISLQDLKENITICEICGNVSDSNICHICSDEERESSVLCVVEGISQLWAMESADNFNGKYFVLKGVLNALDGKGPEEIGINKLVDLISENDEIKEVILAVSASVDGLTTCHVIAERLAQLNRDIRITSLAKGIPVGAGLDYMDSGTLFLALKNRVDVD